MIYLLGVVWNPDSCVERSVCFIVDGVYIGPTLDKDFGHLVAGEQVVLVLLEDALVRQGGRFHHRQVKQRVT
jgi:hypothetical protein